MEFLSLPPSVSHLSDPMSFTAPFTSLPVPTNIELARIRSNT
jgi:hypothetical protein